MRKASKKTLKSKAWRAFARYIKAFYSDRNGQCRCVTCGNVLYFRDSNLHAGHFVSGRGNAVLFDEDLVRPQCAKCNAFRGGEQAKFALYLMEREGKKPEEIAEYLYRRNKVVLYSEADLAEIAEKYNNMADAIIEEKKI